MFQSFGALPVTKTLVKLASTVTTTGDERRRWGVVVAGEAYLPTVFWSALVSSGSSPNSQCGSGSRMPMECGSGARSRPPYNKALVMLSMSILTLFKFFIYYKIAFIFEKKWTKKTRNLWPCFRIRIWMRILIRNTTYQCSGSVRFFSLIRGPYHFPKDC